MGARSDAEAEVADHPGDDVAEDTPDDTVAQGDDPAAGLGDDEVIDAEVVDDDGPGPAQVTKPRWRRTAPRRSATTTSARSARCRPISRTTANVHSNSRPRRSTAATGQLVESLLPVLDACEGGIEHGDEGVTAVFTALLGTLERVGLERVDPAGEPFDPNAHEAVLHEPPGDDDGDATEPVVVEVMRPGYRWKERTLRAAMVKVKG